MNTTKSSKPPGPAIVKAGSEARKLATVIFEVLAGSATPSEASERLGISLVRYYNLELRAINGLILACEPRSKGRVKSGQSVIDELRGENVRLKKECARSHALLRAAQRTLGFTLSQKNRLNCKPGVKKRRNMKPRSLKVVDMLKKQEAVESVAVE